MVATASVPEGFGHTWQWAPAARLMVSVVSETTLTWQPSTVHSLPPARARSATASADTGGWRANSDRPAFASVPRPAPATSSASATARVTTATVRCTGPYPAPR